MVNLHAPFRRARSDDRDLVGALLGERSGAQPVDCVLAEEGGAVIAVLDGRPNGETWRVDALAVAHERVAELGPRILAIADALAADEGLFSVTLDPSALDPDLRAILDQEGFRVGEGGLLVRPVIAQG